MLIFRLFCFILLAITVLSQKYKYKDKKNLLDHYLKLPYRGPNNNKQKLKHKNIQTEHKPVFKNFPNANYLRSESEPNIKNDTTIKETVIEVGEEFRNLIPKNESFNSNSTAKIITKQRLRTNSILDNILNRLLNVTHSTNNITSKSTNYSELENNSENDKNDFENNNKEKSTRKGKRKKKKKKTDSILQDDEKNDKFKKDEKIKQPKNSEQGKGKEKNFGFDYNEDNDIVKKNEKGKQSKNSKQSKGKKTDLNPEYDEEIDKHKKNGKGKQSKNSKQGKGQKKDFSSKNYEEDGDFNKDRKENQPKNSKKGKGKKNNLDPEYNNDSDDYRGNVGKKGKGKNKKQKSDASDHSNKGKKGKKDKSKGKKHHAKGKGKHKEECDDEEMEQKKKRGKDSPEIRIGKASNGGIGYMETTNNKINSGVLNNQWNFHKAKNLKSYNNDAGNKQHKSRMCVLNSYNEYCIGQEVGQKLKKEIIQKNLNSNEKMNSVISQSDIKVSAKKLKKEIINNINKQLMTKVQHLF